MVGVTFVGFDEKHVTCCLRESERHAWCSGRGVFLDPGEPCFESYLRSLMSLRISTLNYRAVLPCWCCAVFIVSQITNLWNSQSITVRTATSISYLHSDHHIRSSITTEAWGFQDVSCGSSRITSHSRLEYCNSLLASGTSVSSSAHLQLFQNTFARVDTQQFPFSRITPITV